MTQAPLRTVGAGSATARGVGDPAVAVRSRRPRRRPARWATPWLFLALPLAFLVVFTYVPVANLFYYSVTSWDGVSPEKELVGFKNFVRLFTTPSLYRVFFVSLYYLAASVVQLVLALYFATVLSFSTRFKNLFKGLLFFPYLVNGVAIGFIFLYFFKPGGTLDSTLALFGIGSHYWLGDQSLVNYSLAGTSVWRYLGLNFVLFLGAISSIPGQLYEAAEIDGANRWQQFRHIILPGIRPIISLSVILALSGSLSVFEIPYIMTEGANGSKTFVIQTVQQAFQFNKVGFASAAAIVLLLIVLLVTWLQRLLVPDGVWTWYDRAAGADRARPVLRTKEARGDSSRTVGARLARALVYASLVLGSLAMALPLVAIVLTSLKTEAEADGTSGSAFTPPESWLNFSNYVTAFVDGHLLTALANTAIILAVSITGTVIIGSMTAYAVDRFDFRFRKVVLALFLLATLVPGITTQVATFQVVNALGLFDTRWSAIVLYTGTDIVAIYIFIQFIRGIPVALDEAARIDGASAFTIYRTIILPNLKPAIATVVIIKGITTYNDFYIPFLYMPSDDLGTMSTALFRFKGPFGAHWEDIAAGTVLVTLPTLIIFLLLQRFIYNGFTSGAVK